jgi:ankyrin repeat protein
MQRSLIKLNKLGNKLEKATANGQEAKVLDLIRTLAAANGKINFKQLLATAIKNGQLELLKTLTHIGADIYAESLMQNNALHYSAETNQVRIINSLIQEYKFNVNKQNLNGKTPLSKAAIKGNIEAIKCLVANKADINLSDYDGASPFIRAVFNAKLSAAIELLKLGADIKGAEGELAFIITAHYIDQCGDNVENASIKEDLIAFARTLYEHGVKPNGIVYKVKYEGNDIEINPIKVINSELPELFDQTPSNKDLTNQYSSQELICEECAEGYEVGFSGENN